MKIPFSPPYIDDDVIKEVINIIRATQDGISKVPPTTRDIQ